MSPEYGGRHYILAIIDALSKYAYCRILINNDTKNTIRAVKNILANDIVPKTPAIIQTDNGSEFGQAFSDFLINQGIKHIKTQAHNPGENGAVERFNRTIKHKLAQMMTCAKTNNWPVLLDKAVENYNNSYHNTIKMVPIDLITGNSDKMAKNTAKNIQKMIAKYIQTMSEKIKVGTKIHLISKETMKRIKNKLMKAHIPQWHDGVFEIKTLKGNKYWIERLDEGPFYRWQIQPIPDEIEENQLNVQVEKRTG